MILQSFNLSIKLLVSFMKMSPLQSESLGLLSQHLNKVLPLPDLKIQVGDSGSLFIISAALPLESSFEFSVLRSESLVDRSLVLYLAFLADLHGL